MSNPTCTVLFAGGGGVEAGFRAAGIDCPQRVEFDEQIAAVNERNFGPGVICAPAQSVDLSRLSPTDGLHASPPCQGASVARSKKLAARDDDGVGICLLDYVDALRPRWVTLENVPPYASRPVFAAILHGLMTRGYDAQWGVVNSAGYGVPQMRKRLILRAVRKGERLAPLTPTHAKEPEPAGLFGSGLLPWNGWYGAIEDLIPTLPESAFAPWQLARLPAGLFETAFVEGTPVGPRPPTCLPPVAPAVTINGGGGGRVHRAFLVSDQAGSEGRVAGVRNAGDPASTVRALCSGGNVPKAFLCRVQGEVGDLALLIDSQNKGSLDRERGVTAPHGHSPAFTVSASANKGMSRAWLEQGRVVAMTAHCLFRFMGFDDSYIRPESRSLASKVAGNAVCPPLATAIARTLPGMEATR